MQSRNHGAVRTEAVKASQSPTMRGAKYWGKLDSPTVIGTDLSILESNLDIMMSKAKGKHSLPPIKSGAQSSRFNINSTIMYSKHDSEKLSSKMDMFALESTLANILNCDVGLSLLERKRNNQEEYRSLLD